MVVADISIHDAERVAAAIGQFGGQAQARQLDVSKEQDVRGMIEDTAASYGRLDYLFNNAGIAIGGDARDLTSEHWHRVLDVNLFGVLNGTLAAYPIMIRQGFGHIINTASVTGLLPQPMNAPYCASKHAVVGLSLSLRLEGADLGVKVSVVCPGRVRTNIYQNTILINVPREQVMAHLPAKMMEASQAARKILNGVARNRAVIVFPASMPWAWRAYRLFPRLVDRAMIMRVRQLRRSRLPSAET